MTWGLLRYGLSCRWACLPAECAAVLGGRSSFADPGLGALRLHPRMPAARVYIRAASRLYLHVCRSAGKCHTWIFWESGILAFLHVPTPFFPPRVVCVFWKRGRAYRELDHTFHLPHLAHGVIFYFFNIEMPSSRDV